MSDRLGSPASIVELSAARRTAIPQPTVRGPVADIAVVGDSLYFDPAPAGWGPENSIVARVDDAVQDALGDVRVRNLSRLGVVIGFPGEAREFGFIPQREHLADVLREGRQRPDLVIIPASSTDLNLHPSQPSAMLVPRLVAELERIVAELSARGIQVLIVPAFGINDEMYDEAHSAYRDAPVRLEAHARVRALNAALTWSGLPLLMPSFTRLDTDRDGIVDASLFTDYNPQLGPDDGVHPNERGHVLIAEQISERLIDVLSRQP